MLTLQNSLLFVSVLLSGLVMGLMYGYACSVNPGLNKLNDAEYLRAMQSINIAIQNPVFFISFIGTLIILPVTTLYSKSHASTACFYLMIAASITYIGGVLAVTAAGNIPLNNALAKFEVSSESVTAIADQRKLFETSWNKFHLIRTIFSVVTTALTIAAVIFSNSIAPNKD